MRLARNYISQTLGRVGISQRRGLAGGVDTEWCKAEVGKGPGRVVAASELRKVEGGWRRGTGGGGDIGQASGGVPRELCAVQQVSCVLQ